MAAPDRRPAEPPFPASLLRNKQVVVCCGAGGVGKTTTAAALGLAAAANGRRVLVLTIDPARRLAEAMGIPASGPLPARVPAEKLAEGNIKGTLDAWMLDPKVVFEQMVRRLAESEEKANTILQNRIYRTLSELVAGMQEYTAAEALYTFVESGKYDLVVLDTPPSRNALDFLDAPQRLVQFVDGRALKMFLRPTGFGAKIASRGTATVLSVLRRLTGVDLIDDLSEFFNAMSGLIGGFRERATKVEELLGAEGTSFLIVTGPAGEPISEAVYLHDKLAESGLPFGGIVVNRVHVAVEGGGTEKQMEAALRKPLGADLAKRVLAGYRDRQGLVERDAANIADLHERVGKAPLLTVPELADEIHDLAGLLSLQPYLFGDD